MQDQTASVLINLLVEAQNTASPVLESAAAAMQATGATFTAVQDKIQSAMMSLQGLGASVAGTMRSVVESSAQAVSSAGSSLQNAATQLRSSSASSATSVGALGTAVGATSVSFASFKDRLTENHSALLTWGAGLGVVAGAALVFGIQHALAFDNALNHVQAFAGATSTQIAQWRETILSMAPTLGLSATNMAQGLYTIASAGIQGAASMTTLTAAARAAAASQTDLTTVISALVPVINAYHLTGSQVAITMDQMSESVIKGNMEFGQFASSVGSVIPIAAELKVPIADVGAAMAIMTNQGNSARESSFLLGSMLRSLLTVGTQAHRTLTELGISTEALDVKQRGLIPTLKNINQILDQGAPTWQQIQKNTGDTTAQSEKLANQLRTTDERLKMLFGGNSEALRAFLLLAHNGFSDFSQMIQTVGNSTSDVAKAMQEAWKNPEFQIQVLKSSMETLAISIGESLLPAFVTLVSAVTPLVQGLGALTNAHPLLTEAVLGAALAFGGFSLAIRGIQAVMMPLQYMLGPLGNMMWVLQMATESETASMGRQRAAAEGLEVSQARLFIAQNDLRTAEIAGTLAANDLAAAEARVAIAEAQQDVAAAEAGVAQAGLAAESVTLSGVLSGLVASFAGATTAVLGFAGASAAFLLTNPVGWAILGAAIGVVAYEKVPAVHAAVNNFVSGAGSALNAWFQFNDDQQTDFVNHMQASGSALDAFGHRVDTLINQNLDNLEKKLDALPPTIGHINDVMNNWLGGTSLARWVDDSNHAIQNWAETTQARLRDQEAASRAAADAQGQHWAQVYGEIGKSSQTAAQQQQADLKAVRDAAQAAANYVKDVQTNASTTLQVYAVGLAQGAGNLDALRRAADQAAADSLDYSQKLAQAKENLAADTGQWGEVIKAESAKYATTVDNTTGALVLALTHHSANIDQLTARAGAAVQAQQVFTQQQQEAGVRITLATGQITAGFSSFASGFASRVTGLEDALAVSMMRHSGNEDSLSAKLVEAQKRLDDYTAAHTRAVASLDALTQREITHALVTGQVNAQVTQYASTLSGRVSSATEMLTQSILHHGVNEDVLSSKLVTAQTNLDNYNAAHVQAIQVLDALMQKEIQHAIVTGQANAAVTSYASTLQTKATGDLEVLTQAILHHSTNIHALAEQARADQQELVKYGQAHKDAAAMVGATSDALKDLSVQISDASRKTMQALVDAAYRQSGGLDLLTSKAVVAAQAQQRYADTTLAQTIKVDTAAGDFAGAFAARQKELQDAVTKWTDRLAMDRPGTAQYTLDEGRLRAANNQLDGFNKNLKDATDAGHAASQSFAVLSQAASDKASRALDAYSLALATGKGNLDDLKMAAISTAGAAAIYTDARKKAEAEVQAALHVTATTFSQLETQLRTRVSTALDTYLLLVERGNNSSRDVNDAWVKLLSTTKAQDDAARLRTQVEQDVALHSRDVSTAMDALKNSLDTGLKNAIAQYVSDTIHHTGNLQADAANIRSHSDAVNANTAVWNKANDIANGTGRSFTSLQQAADTQARGALENLANAMRLGQTDLDGLRDKAVKAAEKSETFATALASAQALVTQALLNARTGLLDFKTTLDGINTAIASQINLIESLILNNQQGFASPANQAQQRQYGGEVPRQTQMQAALDTLTQLYIRQAQLLVIQQDAEMRAARASGDWATVLKLTEDKISHDFTNALDHATLTILNHGAATQGEIAALQRAADARERETLAGQQASQLEVQAEIRAAQAAGDLAGAFDLLSKSDTSQLAQSFSVLEDAFRTGYTSVTALVASYQQHKAQVDLDTQAEIQALQATGQYASALQKLTSQSSQNLSDAMAKAALDVYNFGQITQADLQAVEQARSATQRWTQAQWDAAFATADLATQTSMLKSLFSGLISQQQEQQKILTGPDSANIAMIKANSDLAVSGINAQVKATDDLKSIIGAQANIVKASGDAQIAAVNDSTKILQAQWDLQKASTPQERAVAEAQLAIARVTYQANQAKAQWDIRIAQDQLQQAQSKASWDQAVASADQTVKRDALQVATDQRNIALDLQKIDIQQLSVLNDISSSLGGVNDYGDALRSDLQQLSANQATLRQDQLQQALDEAVAAGISAQASLAASQGAITETEDKAAQQQSAENYDLELAQLNQQLTIAQHLASISTSTKSSASSNAAQVTALNQMLAASVATNETLQETIKFLMTGTPSRGGAVSGQSYETFLHTWNADAMTVTSVPK